VHHLLPVFSAALDFSRALRRPLDKSKDKSNWARIWAPLKMKITPCIVVLLVAPVIVFSLSSSPVDARVRPHPHGHNSQRHALGHEQQGVSDGLASTGHTKLQPGGESALEVEEIWEKQKEQAINRQKAEKNSSVVQRVSVKATSHSLWLMCVRNIPAHLKPE
jgi:hypothetical protein